MKFALYFYQLLLLSESHMRCHVHRYNQVLILFRYRYAFISTAVYKFKHRLSPLCLPMIRIIGATLGGRLIRKLHGKAISQDFFN